MKLRSYSRKEKTPLHDLYCNYKIACPSGKYRKVLKYDVQRIAINLVEFYNRWLKEIGRMSIFVENLAKSFTVSWDKNMVSCYGICFENKNHIKLSKKRLQLVAKATIGNDNFEPDNMFLLMLEDLILHELVHAQLWRSYDRSKKAHGQSFIRIAKFLSNSSNEIKGWPKRCILKPGKLFDFVIGRKNLPAVILWKCPKCKKINERYQEIDLNSDKASSVYRTCGNPKCRYNGQKWILC